MEDTQNSYDPWKTTPQVASPEQNNSGAYNAWGSQQPPQTSANLPKSGQTSQYNPWNSSSQSGEGVAVAPQQQGYNPWSSTPQDVTNAEENLGNQDYNGYCEKFQEKMSGSPQMGTTAAAAWNNYVKQGDAVASLNNAKAGDLIYLAGDGGLGHTGIVSGRDQQGNITFVSATNNGVENVPINQWLQSTGQQLLGIVPK